MAVILAVTAMESVEGEVNNSQHKEVVDQLIKYVKVSYGVSQDVSGGSDVLALGLDSLDIMNYLLFLQEKYGVEIEDDQLQGGALIFDETATLIVASQGLTVEKKF